MELQHNCCMIIMQCVEHVYLITCVGQRRIFKYGTQSYRDVFITSTVSKYSEKVPRYQSNHYHRWVTLVIVMRFV